MKPLRPEHMSEEGMSIVESAEMGDPLLQMADQLAQTLKLESTDDLQDVGKPFQHRFIDVLQTPASLMGMHELRPLKRRLRLVFCFALIFVVAIYLPEWISLPLLIFAYLSIWSGIMAWGSSESLRHRISRKTIGAEVEAFREDANPLARVIIEEIDDEESFNLHMAIKWMPDLRLEAACLMLSMIFVLAFIMRSLELIFSLFENGEGARLLDWILFSINGADSAWGSVLSIYGVETTSIVAREGAAIHIEVVKRLTYELLILRTIFGIFVIRGTTLEAVEAIGHTPENAILNGRRSVPALLRGLRREKDVSTLLNIIIALGVINDRRSKKHLLAFESDDHVLQAARIEALGHLGVEEAVPIAIESLSSADADVRAAASRALLEISPDPHHIGLVAKLLQDDQDASVRRTVVKVLGALEDEIGHQVLRIGLMDSDTGVRRATIQALGSTSNPEDIPLLQHALLSQEENFSLHATIFEAIGRIGGDEARTFLSMATDSYRDWLTDLLPNVKGSEDFINGQVESIEDVIYAGLLGGEALDAVSLDPGNASQYRKGSRTATSLVRISRSIIETIPDASREIRILRARVDEMEVRLQRGETVEIEEILGLQNQIMAVAKSSSDPIKSMVLNQANESLHTRGNIQEHEHTSSPQIDQIHPPESKMVAEDIAINPDGIWIRSENGEWTLVPKGGFENIHALAHNLSASGEYEAALLLYVSLTTHAPDVSHYWRALGGVNQQLQDYPAAVAAYGMAIMNDERDLISRVYRGESNLLAGNVEDGLNDLRIVAQQEDVETEHDAWYQRALLLLQEYSNEA